MKKKPVIKKEKPDYLSKEEMDDISNLEKLHETLHNERLAWEKLITNLSELQTKNRMQGPEKPSNK